MAEPSKRKVVFAPGQGWLVDHFIERGEVSVTDERVETPLCPRGRLYIIDSERLETPPIEPSITFREPELVDQFRERLFQQTLEDIIKKTPVLDPKTLIKVTNP